MQTRCRAMGGRRADVQTLLAGHSDVRFQGEDRVFHSPFSAPNLDWTQAPTSLTAEQRRDLLAALGQTWLALGRPECPASRTPVALPTYGQATAAHRPAAMSF
jgi:hypothetical protein